MNSLSITEGVTCYLVVSAYVRGQQSACVICGSDQIPPPTEEAGMYVLAMLDQGGEGAICTDCARRHTPKFASIADRINRDGTMILRNLVQIMRVNRGIDMAIFLTDHEIGLLMASIENLIELYLADASEEEISRLIELSAAARRQQAHLN